MVCMRGKRQWVPERVEEREGGGYGRHKTVEDTSVSTGHCRERERERERESERERRMVKESEREWGES
jgi:hypothetical protein